LSKSILLIIDDDPVAHETLTALLTKSGYVLEHAASGPEGIRKAIAKCPEVILLDVMMPGMDGFEACRRLRSNSRLAEVPIIMVTALEDRTSKLSGFEAGADDFLSKPFDGLELDLRLRTLKRVARYRQLLDERKKLDEVHQQLKEQNAELKRLSHQVIDAQETERRRLAMELHDEFGQSLTVMKLLLNNPADANLKTLQAANAQALEITSDLLRRVRELSLDLRPTVLDDFGLLVALDWLFKRFKRQKSLPIIHNINPLDERRFPKAVETAVFRVVQEALTNIIRYAGTDEATVTLNFEPDRLEVTIVDTGIGFDQKQIPAGRSAGISGMRERVKLAGGQFRLQSTPGEGTLIVAEFPVEGV
jgi:signal transduction histidine kinase